MFWRMVREAPVLQRRGRFGEKGGGGNSRLPITDSRCVIRGRVKLSGAANHYEEKRQRAAALHDLRRFDALPKNAPASWSAAALCRFCIANAVAQVSQPAVSPISNRQGVENTRRRGTFARFAGWKHCDTAGWETC